MTLKRIDYRKYHPIVEEAVTLYLDLLDTLLPERQKDLYLIGSIADGDFQAGRSDIDFAIVSETAWDETSLAMLAEIHRAILGDSNPMLDGVYLTRRIA
jgi:predicted nucleotidyltransferase